MGGQRGVGFENFWLSREGGHENVSAIFQGSRHANMVVWPHIGGVKYFWLHEGDNDECWADTNILSSRDILTPLPPSQLLTAPSYMHCDKKYYFSHQPVWLNSLINKYKNQEDVVSKRPQIFLGLPWKVIKLWDNWFSHFTDDTFIFCWNTFIGFQYNMYKLRHCQ